MKSSDFVDLAAPDRLELTTLRLTAECSTIRRGLCGDMKINIYLVCLNYINWFVKIFDLLL